MAGSNRVERGKTDDNRRVETYIHEVPIGNGTERVTTIHEEKVPMEVRRVVRETIVPVVTSRRVEEYKDGEVVATEMEVVPDHALNLAPPSQGLTAEDIRLAIRQAVAELTPAGPVPPAEPKAMAPAPRVMSARQMIEDRLEPTAGWADYVLWVVLAVLAAGIVYLGFFRG